jgi:hypothetical protein
MVHKFVKLLAAVLFTGFLAGCGGGGGGGNFTTCADLPTAESVFPGFQEIFANATYRSVERRIQYHNVTNDLAEYDANLTSDNFNLTFENVVLRIGNVSTYEPARFYNKSDDAPSNGIKYASAIIPTAGGRISLHLSSGNTGYNGYDINDTVLGNITDELFDEVFPVVDGCKTGLAYSDSVTGEHGYYNDQLQAMAQQSGFTEGYFLDGEATYEKIVPPFRYIIRWNYILLIGNQTTVQRLITRDGLGLSIY